MPVLGKPRITLGATRNTIQPAQPPTAVTMARLMERLSTLGSISDRYDMADISDKINDRTADAAMPAMVLVMGEGNFGKSSLLNALAGKEIAPVALLPLTWKVDVYRLSGTGREYAQVRYVGDGRRHDMSIEEAQNQCLLEEQFIKSNPGSKPKISEVIWHRTGLALGPNICLVDTPGIAQAGLGVDVTSNRLVKGLGATYTVDEVWHYYYHRADVVLWTFDSSKLNSKETADTLGLLMKQWPKRIVPIATKADKVPQNRWHEIDERFQAAYGEYASRGLEMRPFCTVCGGKSALVGTGVREVQQYLMKEVAAKAVATKIGATSDFCRDTARELSRILGHSAKQLVENLRIMADTADEVALKLMRIGAEQRDQVADRINGYLAAKGEDLYKFLYPIVEHALEVRSFASVQVQLDQFMALSNVESMLDSQLNEISSQIQSLAAALCKQRPLHRVMLSTHGGETREQFTFLIDIEPPVVPPISINGVGYNVPNLEFLDGAFRMFKSLFGMAFRMTDSERASFGFYVQNVQSSFADITRTACVTFQNHIRCQIAPALVKAITASMRISVKSTAEDIINRLQGADDDLQKLRTLSEDATAMPTQFANWARYWVAESRDITLAKNLVMDVLWPEVTNMQTHITSYKARAGIDRRAFQQCFLPAYRKRRQITDAPGQPSKAPSTERKGVSAGIKTMITLGAAPSSIACEMNLADIVAAKRSADLIRLIVEDFTAHMRTDRILTELDPKIQETLPDAVVNGVSDAYLLLLSTEMTARLRGNASLRIEARAPSIKTLKGHFSPKLGAVPFSVCSLSMVAGSVAAVAMHSLNDGFIGTGASVAAGIVLMTISKSQLKRSLRSAAYVAAQQTRNTWITNASYQVAGNINETFFRQLIDKLTVQLSPRPLQRVAVGELTNAD